MRTILAAADGSASADRAVCFAAMLAKSCQAKLVLVSVAAPNLRTARNSGFKAMLETEAITVDEFLENETRMALSGLKLRAEKIYDSDIGVVARVGEPADTIIALAAEHEDPVIVVGRRGRGQLAGLLLGSVSQKLVTHAPCAVLVVP